MQLSTDTVIGLLGLILTVGLPYLDLRKRLDTLLKGQEGILTYEQANDLTEIYSDLVSTHLREALRGYSMRDLPGHYASQNVEAIMNEFHRAYGQIVTKSIKPMVKNFRLRGNHRFADIIERVNKEAIEQAFISIRGSFERALGSEKSLSDVLHSVSATIDAASTAGRQMIQKEIGTLYPKRAEA